jgi:FMNH2-dependent dimethyl sulfone monooxygenase
VKLGLVLPIAPEDGDAATWADIEALARLAEDGGADSLWLADHFFYRPPEAPARQIDYHEAWTLLSALSAVTDRVELGTLVLATSYRPPALVARMAATADLVSGARLILGLGCGWNEPEYRAFGYPFDHRVSRFEESIAIIAPMLRGQEVTFDGRWYRVSGANAGRLARRSIPILIAADRPRMLGLAARWADVWQTAWFGLPDDRFERRRAGLLDACAAVGRGPDTVRIGVGVNVGRDVGALSLDPVAVADGLAHWRDEGADHVQLGVWPAQADSWQIALEGIRRFRQRDPEI